MTDPSIDEGDGVSMQGQVNVVRESMFGLSLTSNKCCLFPTPKIAKMRRDRRSGRKGIVCCRFVVLPVAHQRRMLGTLLFLVFPQARRNPVQNAKKIVVVVFSPHLARPGQNGKFSVLGFRCAWHNPMQSAMEMTASGFSFLLVRPSAKCKDVWCYVMCTTFLPQAGTPP